MSFALTMERLNIGNLTENNERRERLWPIRLGRAIPHLDMRLEMLIDTQLYRDMLEDEEGPETPTETHVDMAQLALLCLELVGGKDYIQKQLDGPYPTAFLAAAVEVFETMGKWLEGPPDEAECCMATYIAYLVSIYGFNATVERHVMLDPEFVGDYPPDEVNAACDRILEEMQLPEELVEILMPVLRTAQVQAEFLALSPTLN